MRVCKLGLFLFVHCLVLSEMTQQFPKDIMEPFLTYLNRMRYLIGASDMRWVRWDDKLADDTKRGAGNCDISNQVYTPFVKFANDLSITNVTIGDKVYPDLTLALVTWWRGQKSIKGFNCGADDDYCNYYVHIMNADTEKIGCTFNICDKFSNTKQKLDYKTGAIIVCRWEWSGHRFTPGEKCGLCSNNCVEDFLCGTPDPSYGIRGYGIYKTRG